MNRAKKLFEILVCVFCAGVLSILLAPLVLPPLVESASSAELPRAGLVPMIFSGDPIGYGGDYAMSLFEKGHGWAVFLLFSAIFAIVAILIKYRTAFGSSRIVEQGILGDAELVATSGGRRGRNVLWDGKGKSPGASLVFGYERGMMVGDPAFAHGWVDAKSGCGKTRSIGYASLFWNVKAGASVVYTARKLTEYKMTHSAIEGEGIKTYLLDLERPKRGCRMNLMDAVNAHVNEGDIASAQRAARQLACDFIKHDDKNPYFSNAARALMTASILLVAMADCDLEKKNLASVARVIREGLTGEGKDPASPLKGYVRGLDANHPARKAASEFLQDNGTTAGRNVASTLMTSISILGDEGIEWMLSGSDFTLRQLAEEQCVLYPHCLGEDDPYNVILAAFYNQLWTTLQGVASERGERLPRPFVILGDEWGNLPRVQCLGEMVSLGRSMDLHVFIFVQNMAQLNKYNNDGDDGAGVDKLLGSMNLQIAMSVMKARPDGEYFSSLAGKKTILVRSDSRNRDGGLLGALRSGQSMSEHQVDLIPSYTFKDRVPLRDGIIVVKGGENAAPGNEGVFEMPIVDATEIVPLAKYFGLGSREQDRQKCEAEENRIKAGSAWAEAKVSVWCPDFSACESGTTLDEDIEADELLAWD